MSVNGIGAMGYPMAAYQNRRANSIMAEGAFAGRMEQVQKSQMAGGEFALHYFDHDEGDHAVGASCGTDYSVTVYEPKDFDPANPVYKVKIRDKDGNETERLVDVSKVDPGNCDYIDMYAYACHVSGNGECPDALSSFMGAGSAAYGLSGNTYQDLTKTVNWMGAVEEMMQMQYDAGNLQGYLDYKKFFDFLTDENPAKAVQKEMDAADYWEREFDRIGVNAPPSVKKAWLEAAEAAGTDGLETSRNGMLSHISQLMVQRVLKGGYSGNSADILGSSVQSAVNAAKEALYALEHPIGGYQDNSPEVVEARKREKLFYQEFLNRLKGTEI